MTAFWIIAALFVAVALLLVLRPLLRRRKPGEVTDRDATNVKLYRDELAELEREHADGSLGEQQYGEARQEIERRLLEDVQTDASEAAAAPAGSRATLWAALAIAIALPLVAVLGYLQFGDIGAISPVVQQEGHPVTPAEMTKLVDKLADRLKKNPDDATGWTMLGRSYAVLGRYQESADAYARAVTLAGDDANLLADYADTLGMARGGNLIGEPMQIVQRGLKVDPNNVKLLALAGSAEFAQQKYAEAVRYWERSLAEIPPGSDFRRAVESSIEEARKAGSLPATAGVEVKAPGVMPGPPLVLRLGGRRLGRRAGAQKGEDRRRLPDRRLRSEGGRMEPEGRSSNETRTGRFIGKRATA